jgi:hypothetical protein
MLNIEIGTDANGSLLTTMLATRRHYAEVCCVIPEKYGNVAADRSDFILP